MASKWRQMFSAMAGLTNDPKSVTDQMKFIEARQEWRIMKWAYERMTKALSEGERDRLRELTLRPIDMTALSELPRGTFGREYIEFFKSENVSATSYVDAWPAMARVIERNWIARRSLKLHDMIHVLLRFTCDPFGEMGVTAFTARNHLDPNHLLTLTGVPVAALVYGDPKRMFASVRHGWRLAKNVGEDLFLSPLEEMFELPLDEARRRCGIPTPVPASVHGPDTSAAIMA